MPTPLKYTCPKCFHEHFTKDGDVHNQDQMVGAVCDQCHYELTADDIVQSDRTLARSILSKSIDR